MTIHSDPNEALVAEISCLRKQIAKRDATPSFNRLMVIWMTPPGVLSGLVTSSLWLAGESDSPVLLFWVLWILFYVAYAVARNLSR